MGEKHGEGEMESIMKKCKEAGERVNKISE